MIHETCRFCDALLQWEDEIISGRCRRCRGWRKDFEPAPLIDQGAGMDDKFR